MTLTLPPSTLAAAISLRAAFTAGREPEAWAVLEFSAWAAQHLNVRKDVEAVMTEHGMIREPEWFARTWARRPSMRGGGRARR